MKIAGFPAIATQKDTSETDFLKNVAAKMGMCRLEPSSQMPSNVRAQAKKSNPSMGSPSHLGIQFKVSECVLSICLVHPGHAPSVSLPSQLSRAGQDCIYVPYLTVYLMISLPEMSYEHCIFMVLANATAEHTNKSPWVCANLSLK
jgi:hypothetical protein